MFKIWRYLGNVTSLEPPLAIFFVKILGSLFLHLVVTFGNMMPTDNNLSSRPTVVCDMVSSLIPIHLKRDVPTLKCPNNRDSPIKITSLISTPGNGPPTRPIKISRNNYFTRKKSTTKKHTGWNISFICDASNCSSFSQTISLSIKSEILFIG